MNLAAIFLGSFTVALSGAVSPGPLLAIAVDRSLSRGFKAGPLVVTGHAFLELVIVVLIFHGLADALNVPVVSRGISIAGGAVLVIMGALTLLRADRAGIPRSGRGVRGCDIWSGVAGSLSNPYWYIWWFTAGVAYLALAAPRGLQGLGVFFFGHVLADYAWYSTVSFSVSKGGGSLSPKSLKRLSAVCGAFLLGFGTWFLSGGAWKP